MSINSDMRKYALQENVPVVSSTGAKSSRWMDKGLISACLYQTSNTLNTQNVQYNSSTHIGFTYYIGLEAGKHRLTRGGITHEITSVNNQDKLVNLLLKEVVGNGE